MVSRLKTAVMPMIHPIDFNTGVATGPPSMSPLVASMNAVSGLTLARASSQPGIVSIGTKAELGSDPINRLTWSQTTVLIMTCRPHPNLPRGRCDLIRACPPNGVAHPSPVHPTRMHLDIRDSLSSGVRPLYMCRSVRVGAGVLRRRFSDLCAAELIVVPRLAARARGTNSM